MNNWERWWRRSAVSPSRKIWVVSGGVLAAAGVHALFEAPWLASWAWLAMAGILLAYAIANAGARRFVAIGLVASCVAFGRYDIVLRQRPPTPPALETPADFLGTVHDEPQAGLSGVGVVLVDVTYTDSASKHVWPGRFSLRLPASTVVVPGERLAWRCRPRPPFLTDGDWSCLVSRFERRGQVGALGFTRAVTKFKSAVRLLAGRVLPEPEASFLLGLLIGDKTGLPTALRQDFRDAGASHVLAVSGYNVSKVSAAAMLLWCVFLIRRRLAAVLTIGAVVGFTVLAGAEAPALRAAIMGALACVAIMLRRRSRGSPALALAAALMLLVDPLALRHDVGFQLSFACLLGMQFWSRPIEEGFRKWPDFWGWHKNLADTLAATLATLPIVVVIFGRLAPLSPIVNVIIIPVIPAAMGLGALTLLLGALWEPLAWPFALATTLVIRFVIGVVSWFARVSPPWSVTWVALAVPVAVVAVWWAWRAWRRNREWREDKNIIDYDYEALS